MTDKPLDITYSMGISKHPVIWTIVGIAFVLLVAWSIAGVS
jgi:hypothetical protein